MKQEGRRLAAELKARLEQLEYLESERARVQKMISELEERKCATYSQPALATQPKGSGYLHPHSNTATDSKSET